MYTIHPQTLTIPTLGRPFKPKSVKKIEIVEKGHTGIEGGGIDAAVHSSTLDPHLPPTATALSTTETLIQTPDLRTDGRRRWVWYYGRNKIKKVSIWNCSSIVALKEQQTRELQGLCFFLLFFLVEAYVEKVTRVLTFVTVKLPTYP